MTTLRKAGASRALRSAAMVLGRSLFPLIALTVICGTVLWGPWVSLALAFVSWRIVARIG